MILRLHLGHIVLITGLAYCKTHRRWMRARRKLANFLSPKIQQGSVLLPLRCSLPGGPVVSSSFNIDGSATWIGYSALNPFF